MRHANYVKRCDGITVQPEYSLSRTPHTPQDHPQGKSNRDAFDLEWRLDPGCTKQCAMDLVLLVQLLVRMRAVSSASASQARRTPNRTRVMNKGQAPGGGSDSSSDRQARRVVDRNRDEPRGTSGRGLTHQRHIKAHQGWSLTPWCASRWMPQSGATP
ncbi:hypothetical protein KVT40_001752 [Elsinoe batatas]|uniref:Uncharacterized protein n=1 Tax=Elsinoe batatas TaxID=2601811 RepID=A0A8K0PK20_9PEZI|nr:hypothetical protein KVT40_001752 [Elsinoe batatas]